VSREIYVGLSGASAAWANYEIIANNVANASTTGFKATRSFHEVVGPSEHALGKVYAMNRGASFDPTDGSIVTDNVSTHLALRGSGFFVVDDGGSQLLTRDGRFSVNAQNLLVDAGGRPVQGDGGPIELPQGEVVRVGPDGTVFAGDQEVARLSVVDGAVEQVGLNGFRATGTLGSASAEVVQGALETSNVNAVAAMVELVQASRMFEAHQKAMQASDDLDARLNRFGGR
jgi:flagellar basal-body rod protein FlgF